MIGDRQKTYAIYTYFCPSGLSPYHPDFIPHPISGTVGVSIEDLFDREFRYSNTDYAVEMRCINRIVDSTFDYNWYNLYYDLTNVRTRSETDRDIPGDQEIPDTTGEFLLNWSADKIVKIHFGTDSSLFLSVGKL